MDCIVCQAQSMATVPTVTRGSGPILSLTSKQCTKYALFLSNNSDGCSLRGSSNYDLPTKRLQEHEGIVTKHGDLVSMLDWLINTLYWCPQVDHHTMTQAESADQPAVGPDSQLLNASKIA